MIKNFEITTTVFFKQIDKILHQKVRLFLEKENNKELKNITLLIHSAGWEKKLTFAEKELVDNYFDFFIPAARNSEKINAEISDGDSTLKKEFILKPRRKWEIHIQNFTHTDIGYTDLPSRVVRVYRESARAILDFYDETRDFDEGSKYKWNIETGYWLENALTGLKKNELKKFQDLIKSGFIEITPLYVAHTSEFNDEETLIRSLYFAFKFAKECGVNIVTAMSSDVTGQPWLLPQILSRSGIKYFSTAVNATMAKALKLERPFYWQSLDGSKVMVLDTDERQAYQEGVMIGLHEDYETVYEKLPKYLEDLEDTGNFNFDLIAFRMPGYPGDNTKPNVKVSYIVREWNRIWDYPKLIISTYRDYFHKFERLYGDKINTYSGAWPDWWVNYHGAAAFETGVNRKTHSDIINAERFSTILNINEKESYKYPKSGIDYVYSKLFLADEADWGSYNSVSEPDCLQSKGQRYENASFVYQAAIDAKELSDNSRNLLSKMSGIDTELGIVVSNPLSFNRSEIVEISVPKKIFNNGKGFKIIDSVTGKEVKSQFILPELHDLQTASLRIAFFAEGVPPLGFKVFNFIIDDSDKNYETSKSLLSAQIENDFYKVIFEQDSGTIKKIIDKDLKKDITDGKSDYQFNQFIYDSDENKRIVDLSQHEELKKDVLFLQPFYRKLHEDFYDSPTKKVKFKRYFAENHKISEVRRGPLYTEITTTASSFMFPEIKTSLILDNMNKRIIIRNYLFKYENLNIESLYFMFPFNSVKPSIKINCHGGFFEPEKEQLPGSSKDWYCVQKWVSVSDHDVMFLFSPFEAPLVQLGGINTGKYLDKIELDNGTIASFVMNNHWWTNSPASQCGRFEFKYFISSLKAPFNPVSSNRFGWSSHFPLNADFITGNSNKGNYKEYSLITAELPENIMLIGFKKAENGRGIILRMIETVGQSCNFDFVFSDKKIKEAFLLNPIEEKINNVNLKNNAIEMKFDPFELLTFYIELY